MSAVPPPPRPSRPPLTVYLAAPRGFCAGVDRAIQIVELALAKFGAPVYVRHEIVHNRFVVDNLKAKGAVFVEELDEIPRDGPTCDLFGTRRAKSVPAAAKAPQYVRHRCHLPAGLQSAYRGRPPSRGRPARSLLIGHAGHPEVEGTMGQLPEGAVTLIETVADAPRIRAARSGQARLSSRRRPCRSMTLRRSSPCCAALPEHRRPAQGRHLLRHDEPPGGRQGHRAEDRLPARRRQPAELQLAAPGRGRAARRLPDRASHRRRRRHPLGAIRGRGQPSA